MADGSYIITFGKHKGTSLEDIPASYLLWLSEQHWVEIKYPEITAYINENYSQISNEAGQDNYEYYNS